MATSTHGNDDQAGTSPAAGAENEFESVEQDVFEAAGLNTKSRVVALEEPRIRLRVIEAGNLENDDDTIVFVHGGGWFGAVFAPLMAHLDDKRLITIDRPGCGLSDNFAYTTANHRDTIRDVLSRVLDDLGIERASIAGSSTGGYWSIVFGLTRPERVRKIIPIGGVPTFPGTRPPVPIRLLTVPVINRVMARFQPQGEDGVLQMMEVAGEGDTIQRYPDLIRARVAHDRMPRPINERFSEFSSLVRLRGWRPSTRLRTAELRDLQRPTMFIWGTNDFMGGPDAVRAAVNVIPESRLEPIETGHGPWFGRPGECAQLIRDLQD